MAADTSRLTSVQSVSVMSLPSLPSARARSMVMRMTEADFWGTWRTSTSSTPWARQTGSMMASSVVMSASVRLDMEDRRWRPAPKNPQKCEKGGPGSPPLQGFLQWRPESTTVGESAQALGRALPIHRALR
jgi:hypothetical protein